MDDRAQGSDDHTEGGNWSYVEGPTPHHSTAPKKVRRCDTTRTLKQDVCVRCGDRQTEGMQRNLAAASCGEGAGLHRQVRFCPMASLQLGESLPRFAPSLAPCCFSVVVAKEDERRRVLFTPVQPQPQAQAQREREGVGVRRREQMGKVREG